MAGEQGGRPQNMLRTLRAVCSSAVNVDSSTEWARSSKKLPIAAVLCRGGGGGEAPPCQGTVTRSPYTRKGDRSSLSPHAACWPHASASACDSASASACAVVDSQLQWRRTLNITSLPYAQLHMGCGIPFSRIHGASCARHGLTFNPVSNFSNFGWNSRGAHL